MAIGGRACTAPCGADGALLLFCEMAMLNTGQASGCTKEVLLRAGWLTSWE